MPDVSPLVTIRRLEGLGPSEDPFDYVSSRAEAGQTAEEIRMSIEATKDEQPAVEHDPGNSTNGKHVATAAFSPGDLVKTSDRGNFGTVLECRGKSVLVHFVAPDGNVADVAFDEGELTLAGGLANSDPGEPFKIHTITSEELDQGDYRVVWLVEDVMAAGQQMVIAAQLKSMKTTLAIALAIALATGRPFLGVFKVLNPVRVLVCSGESGLAAIKETASRIAYAQGDSLRGLRNLIWSSDLPRFDNPVHLQAFRDVIEQGEIGVVILDPMYFCLPGADAGNLMVVGALLRGVSQICEETKTTLIVVHHVRKSLENPHDPPELSDVSWSGTSEWARQWILLSRRRRYEPGTGQHDLWMSVGGSAGHNGLWALDIFEGVGTERSWDVSLSNPDDARNASTNAREEAKTTRKAEQLERDKRAILDAVLKLPDHRGTLSEIRTRTGRNGQAFSVALADLVNDRHLVACQIPKPNGRQYEGFRLSDEQE